MNPRCLSSRGITALMALALCAGLVVAACHTDSNASLADAHVTGAAGSDGGAGRDGDASDAASDGDASDGQDSGCSNGPSSDAAASGQCGSAPLITVSGTSIDIGPIPVGFVTGYSSLCDSGTPIVVSGQDGAFSFEVSESTPVSFTLEKDCYFTTISGPFSFAGDVSGVRPFILSHAWKSNFPDYTSDTATILVYALLSANPPCDASGVVVGVPEQPNAKVSYPQSDGGIGASVPFAVIGGLTAGGFASVEGSKPGCTVDFSQFYQTGRFPLVAGAVSIALAEVSAPN